MTKVVLDSSWQSKLPGLAKPLELCDESGALLGYFLPPNGRDRAWFDWASKQFTDDEIDQARKQTGGRTLPEILAGLPQE